MRIPSPWRLRPLLVGALPLVAVACGSTRHAAAPCTSGALRAQVGSTGVATGNYYTPIRLTNASGASCILDGYPGVRFIDAHGDVVGRAAQGTPHVFRAPPRRRFVLRPGRTATFSLHTTAANGRACRSAGRLAVTPPGSHGQLVVAFAAAVCPGGLPDVSVIVPGPRGPAPG